MPACGGNDIDELNESDSDVIEGITKIKQPCICLNDKCSTAFDAWFVLADYEIWRDD